MAPASDDRKARKALASIADEVVLDLEDAVTPANKDSARAAAADLVAEFGAERAVSLRINAIDTPWARADLAACAQMSALTSVVLPKADTPADLQSADAQLGDSSARLQALLETPRGIRDAGAICAATDRLDAVMIGYADLGASLGRASGLPMQTWHVVQETVLLAARAAGVDVIDGPHLTIADDDGFRDAKRWVRDLGFDGTWVIHPAQLASAIEIFTPDQAAIDDARRVLEALEKAAAAGAGAAELDGRMLDEALAVSARRILAKGAAE
ncbi:CoA ester lyase [Gordonia sp. zg691]|uniref:HpcH/HpaI aldolase/citrate lyase family protein n=1 Tax=Gordonia jinghuaiqii TaxID=2758710 RepID=UPI0016627154|nr:CoA ester lyase [Gordonia jinghuaiqii]MBD0863607.1 CoA ester lyase [Gordonia jinghuaiqii]